MELDLLGNNVRTHRCGELRPEHAGQQVFLAGWVSRRRDLGNLIFIDLRDHTGVIQVVCRPEVSAEVHAKAGQVRSEYVLGIEGEVALRSPETVNRDLATGEVEVVVRQLLVLNEARTPPFPIDDEGRLNEEARLRYRYVDLRRSRMQHHLRLRHEASLVVRRHMTEHGFIEIETPFLTRSTPEGARDYLVPSRVQPGKFYALPQSPQIFKQILMIAGFDRYFQIVRCFRDEDLRADRQPEFTQIDIEMAFPTRDVLFGIIEGLMSRLFALVDVKLQRPFLILPYDEAMEKFGSDKPDLRFELAWKRLDLPEGARGKIHVAEPIKALRVPGAAEFSRAQLDKLQEVAKKSGADWFSYIKVATPEAQSPLAKVAGEEAVRSLVSTAGAAPGDLVLLLGLRANPAAPGRGHHLSIEALRRLDSASGDVRLELARRLELIKPGTWAFCWVVDFPMFEYDEKGMRYSAMHHPFTSPREEDLDKIESDPSACKARAYDMVLNGSELGGGSIRIHRPDVQRRVFSTLGISEEKARARFGFLLDALESGAPPHGGIALGWDRTIALMCGETNIREVIAFPKTASATDLMCDAPGPADGSQLEELELMAACPEPPISAQDLAHFNDRLLDFIANKLLVTPKFQTSVDANVFSQGATFEDVHNLFICFSYKTARTAVRLCKSGFGRQAAALARSLYELRINSQWAAQGDSKARTKILCRELISTNPASALTQAGLPVGSVDERATEVGVSATYGRAAALQKTLALDPNVSSYFKLQALASEPSSEWIDEVLLMSFDCVYSITKQGYVGGSPDLAELEALREKFLTYERFLVDRKIVEDGWIAEEPQVART